jgi:hypothetical protein
MKLIITRPVVITGDGGVRTFAPGLTVEVDAVTAEQIIAQQAGTVVKDVANADTPAIPATPRRKKAADAET